MNWLAHLYLSKPDPEERLGQVLADVFRPNERLCWTAGVVAGAALHQKIDLFTDAHPAFKQSKARLSAPRRRYGGIIIDLFYDYFLTQQWAQWSPQPLEMFLQEVEHDFRSCATASDPDVCAFLDRLFDQRWLWDYGTIPGLGVTFRRVTCRLSRHSTLAGSEEELAAQETALAQDFGCFFPDLIAYVQSQTQTTGSCLTLPNPQIVATKGDL